jgi:hypothetical protein
MTASTYPITSLGGQNIIQNPASQGLETAIDDSGNPITTKTLTDSFGGLNRETEASTTFKGGFRTSQTARPSRTMRNAQTPPTAAETQQVTGSLSTAVIVGIIITSLTMFTGLVIGAIVLLSKFRNRRKNRIEIDSDVMAELPVSGMLRYELCNSRMRLELPMPTRSPVELRADHSVEELAVKTG